MVRGGQRGCCSVLIDSMWHSELPEHLCSSQLDGLLGEGLVICQCDRGGSCRVHSGNEDCVPADSEGCDANGGN